MHSSSAVLLPDVFDPKVIKLGHLLRNPLEPAVKKVAPSDEIFQDKALEITDGLVTEPYHGTVSLDKKGAFLVGFTHLLHLGIRGNHAEFLEIDAEKMTEQSFVDGSAALAKICSDTAVEEWIRPFARLRKPVYFVVGLQTLHNAKFKKAVGSVAGVEAYATLPLDPSTQIPVRVRAQLSRERTGTSEGTVSGVFGIKVLKGTWATFRANEEPRWAEKPHWKWVYETKGGQDTEKFMGLEIQELDQSELEELQKARWADEEEEEEEEDD